MNRLAHKCGHCKKAFQGRKIDQLYCSNKCRQAAYRERKQSGTAKKTRPAILLRVMVCEHCTGTFFGKTRRSKFCSTSCRTLYHRHMKAALPAALIALYRLPEEKAVELIETQPVSRLKAILAESGLSYSSTRRAWIG